MFPPLDHFTRCAP